jgi:GT2 family glycosyltransferase
LKLEDAENSVIVIIDNSFTVSDTGTLLKSEFKNIPQIFVIPNKENTFFSFGNNLGYAFAKRLGAEFVIMTNNDIIFPQRDFYKKVKRKMNKSQFFICGPNILDLTSECATSPIAWECLTEKEAEQDIVFYMKECEKIKRGGGKTKETIIEYKQKCPGILKQINRLQIELWKLIKIKYGKKNYPVLQGSCIIASWLFIEKNDKIFVPETEFYGEEQLLAFRCRKAGYKMVYAGNIKVLHKGGISVAYDYADLKERKLLTYQRIIKAREAYIKYINIKD